MNTYQQPSNASTMQSTAISAGYLDTESTPLLQTSLHENPLSWTTSLATLTRYSLPVIVANLLQFTLNMSSMLIISPRGKIEFGAVSVATTTANITGFMVFQGLATSLDTLCAQAWGSGNPSLVRLHVQRMTVLLGAVGIVVSLSWFFAEKLFMVVLPEKETAVLAGLYLRVLVCAIPGYVVFEAGKRVLMAEGVFLPITIVVGIGAATNALLGWLLVWRWKLGYIGAPIAVAMTWTLVPLYFWLYLHSVGKGDIWSSMTTKALAGWSPMLKLALPGLVMIEAEYVAFEILVIAAAQLSTADLAAQTILATINGAFWQIPFSIGIAGTTLIAQHIGAGSAQEARSSAVVVFLVALLCSSTNSVLFFSFRGFWPLVFTQEPEVVQLVKHALPLVALMQLFDGLVANCNGILRGIGRQSVGGWVNLSCYYIVALPLSLWTAFGLHWGLKGLWVGVTVVLVLVTIAEVAYLVTADWQRSVDDARDRNSP